jgi:hypothetical protein
MTTHADDRWIGHFLAQGNPAVTSLGRGLERAPQRAPATGHPAAHPRTHSGEPAHVTEN